MLCRGWKTPSASTKLIHRDPISSSYGVVRSTGGRYFIAVRRWLWGVKVGAKRTPAVGAAEGRMSEEAARGVEGAAAMVGWTKTRKRACVVVEMCRVCAIFFIVFGIPTV